MREDQNIGLKSPTGHDHGRYDYCGHGDPEGRQEVVQASINMYCSICDARPCFLLSTAAIAVMHEQLTEAGGENLIGAARYGQSLEKLHRCLVRHHEKTVNAWQLNIDFEISERALAEIERLRRDTEQAQYLQKEARDPPRLN